MVVDLGAPVAAVVAASQGEPAGMVGRGARGGLGPGIAECAADGVDGKYEGCYEEEGVVEEEGRHL